MIYDNESDCNWKIGRISTTQIDLGQYKHKMYLSIKMVVCIKQHLSNMWSSIHEKVKQHWGWVAYKRSVVYKKSVYLTNRKRYCLDFLIYYGTKREFDFTASQRAFFEIEKTTFGGLFVSWIKSETILKN